MEFEDEVFYINNKALAMRRCNADDASPRVLCTEVTCTQDQGRGEWLSKC